MEYRWLSAAVFFVSAGFLCAGRKGKKEKVQKWGDM
jgi:hypothetical protein